MRPAFSSRARHRAEWRGNTLVPRARSRTARSESSLPTFRATVMRSSIVRCIFQRNGPTIPDRLAAAYVGLWTRGLLIRRHIADGDLAFFTTWCPAGTSLETLVAVEGHRWAIEDSFEPAKNEFGLDHNESRSWHGWHRHVSLVMLAFAMMAVIRHRANAMPPPKTIRRPPAKAKA